MLSVKLLGIVLTTLMLVNVATCWFETCSTNQTLPAGGSLTISSPYYPNYRYPSGSSCLYFVQAPLDYAIQVSCSLNVDQTTNCASQTFYISRDGEKSLAGAEFFCGSGSVARTTVSNELYFGYTSNNDGKSGYFSCVLTTVSIGPTSGNCDCGWSFNTKIVGGTDAVTNQFPSNVGLVDSVSKAIFCHGSIIHYRYILSVAHCFISNNKPANIYALVGDQDISTGADTPFSALYTIEAIINHESYNPNSATNAFDIALLRTVNYIKYKRAIGPICLPYKYRNNDALMDNQVVSAAGWGSTSFGGPITNILQVVSLNTITNSACSAKMSNIDGNKICTYTAGKDTCQYDSGSSLYYYASRLYTVGLSSYGVACATSNPSVSTRVTSFISWIEQKTGPVFCNK